MGHLSCTAQLSHLTWVQPGTLITLRLYFISVLLHNIDTEEFLESGLADTELGKELIDLKSRIMYFNITVEFFRAHFAAFCGRNITALSSHAAPALAAFLTFSQVVPM